MKKLLISLLCIFVAASLFAANIGVSTGLVVECEAPESLETLNINNFVFGVNTSVRLTILSVDASVFPIHVDDEYIVTGHLFGNLTLAVSWLYVEAGVGFPYMWNITGQDFYRGETLLAKAGVGIRVKGLNFKLYAYEPLEALFTYEKLIFGAVFSAAL